VGLASGEETNRNKENIPNGHNSIVPQLRAKVCGVVPKISSIDNPKTFKTPTRRVKEQIENGRVDEEVRDRWNKCTGFALQVVSDKSGNVEWRRLVVCFAKTGFYCIGCRLFFCMRTTKNHTNIYCLRIIEKDKSCFHEKHEIAYKHVSNEQNFD